MKKLFVVLFAILVFFTSASVVYAEEPNNNGSFSVSPLNSETGEVQSNYYDLMVSPNQKLVLKARIFNSSRDKLHIKVEANDATTNDNGITSYLKTEKRDSSLKVAFSDFSQVEQEVVTVEANSSVDVAVNVNIPNESFKGTILGGLRFTDVDTEKNTEKSTSAVTNHIAYVVAVVLKESENEITPDLKLNSVITEQRNGRNYISANLQNVAPRLIKKLEVNAKVYKKGTNELQYESSKNELKMAPNSNFNNGTSLEDQAFVAGDYTMKLSGFADGTPFSFEKDFTIEKKEAADFNKNAVYIKNTPQDNMLIYVSIAIIITILIFGISIIFFRKGRGK